MESEYHVVTLDFLAYGGNGYQDLRNGSRKYKIRQGPLDLDAVNRSIVVNSPIYAKVEGRVVIISPSDKCNNTQPSDLLDEVCSSTINNADQAVPIVVMVVLVAIVASVVLFVIWMRKRRRDENDKTEEEEAELNDKQ